MKGLGNLQPTWHSPTNFPTLYSKVCEKYQLISAIIIIGISRATNATIPPIFAFVSFAFEALSPNHNAMNAMISDTKRVPNPAQ